MSTASGSESLEIERKYEVAFDAELPSSTDFERAGFGVDTPRAFSLVARYFETPGEDLAAAGLAVRVREGGADAGWHVKQREAAGVREFQWPPAPEMPAELIALLRERVGDAADEVQPRVVMRTERTIVVLRDASGAGLVEVADDLVHASDLAVGVERAWREWESELLPGAEEAQLDVVAPVLRAAGALPSVSPAKIARATGRLVSLAQAHGADESQVAALRELDAADQEAARRLSS